jgi:hypothetical protein
MITKKAVNEIKAISKEEITVTYVHPTENEIGVILPFSDAEFDIVVEGDNTEEQVEDFKEKVNLELEAMVNHLHDVML